MRKLRLLFLDFQVPYLLKDAEYPVGGACVRQVALAQGLASVGHRVGILTWKGARQYAGGEQAFDLVESFHPDAGPRKLRYFFYRFPSLLRAAKSFDPDYVFQKCVGGDTATMAAIARLLGVPFVYMAANDIDADGGYRRRLGFLERAAYVRALRNADGIIVQNQYQLREFTKWLKGKNIAVVHNPVSFGEGPLPPIKPRSERGYFAWLGVFQPQKNLPALLRIARRTPEVEFRVGGM
ncbi:MAG: glycosyltransferase, partial [Nitrospirota bacterium]